MEIVVHILKQLPSGWPRITILLGIGLLFFLPELRRLLSRELHKNERYEDAKKLLEIRQLEITVAELKAKNPDVQNEPIDSRIQELLDGPAPAPNSSELLKWPDRFKFSLAGSFSLMVLGTLALWQSGEFSAESPVHVIMVEAGLTMLCAFLASAVPSSNRWECVFRGFLIPAFLGALIATAIGNS